MLAQTIEFFLSFFADPSLIGIGLAIVFGVIWLLGYWPPLFRQPWLWAVMVVSAFLTLAAISFVQIPLQILSGQLLVRVWGMEAIVLAPLVAGIPAILLSGLVQEGAKLVPVVIFWWRKHKALTPRLGLAVGALAGASFGIFEAQWVHNAIFASDWTWGMVQTIGLSALAGFWERFFAVAAHIGFSALAGYGLAKGWGWQFYLVASVLHAILNYIAILFQTNVMTVIQVEIYVAVWAVLVTGIALWLRWKKPTETTD